MSGITRRGFMASLAAAGATLAAAPAMASLQVNGGVFRLSGQEIILHKTLVLRGLVRCEFVSCTFKAAPNFKGDHLIDVRECGRVIVENCDFEF